MFCQNYHSNTVPASATRTYAVFLTAPHIVTTALRL